MAMDNFNSPNLRKQVKGTTLKVYIFLARNKDVGDWGVREISRQLQLSSASHASYHLKRLEELGLIEKTKQIIYSIVALWRHGKFMLWCVSIELFFSLTAWKR